MRRLAVQTLVAVSMLGVLGACAKPAPEPADLGAVQKALHAAADEYGVPRALMVAIGWVDSRLSMNAGAPSVDGAYGVFHLVDGESAADPNGRSRAQSLKLASRLTGLSETALRADLQANARGAAALLRAEMDRLEGQYPDLRDDSLGDWFEVTMRASGVEDAQLADGYASQVYRLLRDGLTVVDEQGGLVRLLPQTFSLSGRAIWASLEQDLSGEYCPNGACVAWVPASTSNYMAGRDGYTIDTIVIHDMEGSYSGSIAWFQDPAAQASAHYCIRSSDGEITQQVHHADTA
ncbi:MAG: N-acetylmuramoyl-L-alanine amidase, partial [Deltaproteobacteria bacterium]|nr:N-acetylmuramoyl-L-alanine amidase [Deltaproteobacteria bacterium]